MFTKKCNNFALGGVVIYHAFRQDPSSRFRCPFHIHRCFRQQREYQASPSRHLRGYLPFPRPPFVYLPRLRPSRSLQLLQASSPQVQYRRHVSGALSPLASASRRRAHSLQHTTYHQSARAIFLSLPHVYLRSSLQDL